MLDKIDIQKQINMEVKKSNLWGVRYVTMCGGKGDISDVLLGEGTVHDALISIVIWIDGEEEVGDAMQITFNNSVRGYIQICYI